MSMEYIRKAYGVPAKRGMRVKTWRGNGVITGSAGARLRILIDGDPGSAIYHPTDRIEYPRPEKQEQAA